MNGRKPMRLGGRAALLIAAVTALAGVSMRVSLAQQAVTGAGGSTHGAPGEAKAGKELDIPMSLPAPRPIRQYTTIAAPHFLKMTPAKDRPISLPAPNAIDRNPIGVRLVRHDAAPAAPLLGQIVVRAPAPQPVGGSSLGTRGGETVLVPVRGSGAQPLVFNRSTIGGASFARPGTALLPLGGPARPGATSIAGATSINGTSIRPKH